MGGGGGTADTLCAACAWQVESSADLYGGASAEWDFAADMDDLTSALGVDELIVDASAYLVAYPDPTLTQCIMGIGIAVTAGGASGFSPGNKTIRMRHAPPLRHIRLKKL